MRAFTLIFFIFAFILLTFSIYQSHDITEKGNNIENLPLVKCVTCVPNTEIEQTKNGITISNQDKAIYKIFQARSSQREKIKKEEEVKNKTKTIATETSHTSVNVNDRDTETYMNNEILEIINKRRKQLDNERQTDNVLNHDKNSVLVENSQPSNIYDLYDALKDEQN